MGCWRCVCVCVWARILRYTTTTRRRSEAEKVHPVGRAGIYRWQYKWSFSLFSSPPIHPPPLSSPSFSIFPRIYPFGRTEPVTIILHGCWGGPTSTNSIDRYSNGSGDGGDGRLHTHTHTECRSIHRKRRRRRRRFELIVSGDAYYRLKRERERESG